MTLRQSVIAVGCFVSFPFLALWITVILLTLCSR